MQGYFYNFKSDSSIERVLYEGNFIEIIFHTHATRKQKDIVIRLLQDNLLCSSVINFSITENSLRISLIKHRFLSEENKKPKMDRLFLNIIDNLKIYLSDDICQQFFNNEDKGEDESNTDDQDDPIFKQFVI